MRSLFQFLINRVPNEHVPKFNIMQFLFFAMMKLKHENNLQLIHNLQMDWL